MAQQPPIDAEGHIPGNYRTLYTAVGFQAGEPEPGRLVASYRFTKVAGGGSCPTPANLQEQYFLFSESRPMTFLCLARLSGASVEMCVLHSMMRYFELPGVGGCGILDLVWGFLGMSELRGFPSWR